MKNSPALSRLHRGTHRMTDCTFLPPPGRKILHQIVCFARDTRSVSCWCCRLVCLNWAALIWKFLAWSQSEWSLLSWHSAAAKYAAGLMSHRRRVLRISVGQCSGTPGSWDDKSSWTRDSCFHLAGFVAGEQPWPQSNWLWSLGPDAATSLPDKSTERGRFETASDWRVERNGTRRYWWRRWPVVQTSPCMYSGQRETLWIFTVIC